MNRTSGEIFKLRFFILINQESSKQFMLFNVQAQQAQNSILKLDLYDLEKLYVIQFDSTPWHVGMVEETEGYDHNLDDIMFIIKKYIPIDYSELDRTQAIKNNFPKDIKNLAYLDN
ncbi:hypothetical protein ABPG74_020260 [Tetrahymena malaccensis]